MTTVRQLITDAMRESNIIAVGSVPEADEFEEALRRFQVLVDSLYGEVIGEPLRTVSFGDSGLVNSYAKREDMSSYIGSTYVPHNVRLVFNIDVAKIVYLQPNPQDGARFALVDNAGTFNTANVTVNSNGRQIEDADSVVLSTAGVNRQWFYRADLANWVRISDLTADSQSPFPSEFDDFLSTLLAFRLNPRYGIETKGETSGILTRMRTLFRARYRQKLDIGVEEGLIRLTTYRCPIDQNDFDLGLL